MMDLCAGGQWEDELLPVKVDRLAKLVPDELWAEYPKVSNSYEEGYHKVTYKKLANIVNGLAWWLQKTLGVPDTAAEVISYIGPNDFRYPALVLAAAKAGYVLFLTSPRNSLVAHGRLFDELKCKVLISTETPTSLVSSTIDEHGLKSFAAPSIQELWDREYPSFPYAQDYESSLKKPFLVVHTSGSTGIPKPLIWTHATAIGMTKLNAIDPPPGQRSLNHMHTGKRVLCSFPPFHGAGIVCYVFWAITFRTVMVTPVAEGIVTAENLAVACSQNQVEIGIFVPSLIAELASNTKLLDTCAKHLEMILYCGGDLPQAIGDIISAKCPLYCQYGASEIGLTAQLVPVEANRKDWHYIQLHPSMGIEFEPSADNLFEAHVRKDDNKDSMQPTFTQLSKLHLLTDYATRDLFAPHPVIPDFWTYKARADDIIVFLNGEKTNPISMEQSVVSGSDAVQNALVIGDQRFQAAMLIETKGEIDTKEHFVDLIWPIIQQANSSAPAHARIEKRLIIVTDPAKPMIRSGKGTIQRKATLNLYAEEIQQLYDSVENEFASSNGEGALTKYDDAVKGIKEVIGTILGLNIEENDNLFLLGMDSVQGLQLMRGLKRWRYLPDLTLQQIYRYPTISSLAKSLITNGATLPLDRTQQMQDVFQNLEAKLLSNRPTHATAKEMPSTVILTGSTGGLGTHLLDAILKDSKIIHVYCLNRRMDDCTSFLDRLNWQGNHEPSIAQKVSFHQVDFNHPNFGLDDTTFRVLQTHPHYIIHNAWTVNFNLSLDYYIPQLHSLVNLLQFAAATSSRFTFISSISSVMSLAQEHISEGISRSWNSPAKNGYAESKFIGELLCATAMKSLGISATSMRVGQIAGPVETPGVWNPNEWLPTIVSTAASLNALPETLGSHLNHVDWVPIDLVSRSIWEAVTSRLQSPDVLHFCNPQSMSWSTVAKILQETMENSTHERFDIIPTNKWLHKAESLADEDPAAPVAKLLDFYRANILESKTRWSLDYSRAVERSQTLKMMPAVGPPWIKKWVQEWHSYSDHGRKLVS